MTARQELDHLTRRFSGREGGSDGPVMTFAEAIRYLQLALELKLVTWDDIMKRLEPDPSGGHAKL